MSAEGESGAREAAGGDLRRRSRRLPSGAHGIPREAVEDDQRERLVAAIAAIAHERGLAEVSVSRIVEQAGISRKTFYELFESKGECVERACEEAHARLFAGVALASEAGGAWLDRVERAVGALLDAATADPLGAELCLIHARAVRGGVGEARWEKGVETMAEAIRGGSETEGEEAERGPLGLSVEFSACAVLWLVALQVRWSGSEGVAGMRGELVRLVADSFLGVVGSVRSARRSVGAA
jgi:AcrR family transcriptional regulator